MLEQKLNHPTHGRAPSESNNLGSLWPIRIGCGLVNLYAGYFLLIDPSRYYKYVPDWLVSIANSVASVDVYLRLQGVAEIAIAVALLSWFTPRSLVRMASIALALEMALIVLFVGIDSVTFRNLGLLGAALSITLATSQERRSEARAPRLEDTVFAMRAQMGSTRV